MGHLDDVDLSQRLKRKEYERRLLHAQDRFAQVRLALGGLAGTGEIGPPVMIALEGWDAAGKGGAIKRLVRPLDARHYRVEQYAAPTPDDVRRHWLQRFWRAIPGRGGLAIFDRTWYGRVLVERIEGFSPERDWRRAYGEIREFERTLADEGYVLVKLWVHLSDEEQLKRFQKRRDDPLKAWKLTDEDWRNRGKRDAYASAVEEMIDETDAERSPWHVIAGEQKKFGRVQTVETVLRRIEEACEAQGFALPDPIATTRG